MPEGQGAKDRMQEAFSAKVDSADFRRVQKAQCRMFQSGDRQRISGQREVDRGQWTSWTVGTRAVGQFGQNLGRGQRAYRAVDRGQWTVDSGQRAECRLVGSG